MRHIVKGVRACWPRVEILVRGDSHYARPDAMTGCEHNRVGYIFGLAANPVLLTKVAALAEDAAVSPAPARARKCAAMASSAIRLARPARLPAPVDVLELHPSQSLQHLRPPHPPLPAGREDPTGQIVSCETRTYHVLRTPGDVPVDKVLILPKIFKRSPGMASRISVSPAPRMLGCAKFRRASPHNIPASRWRETQCQRRQQRSSSTGNRWRDSSSYWGRVLP